MADDVIRMFSVSDSKTTAGVLSINKQDTTNIYSFYRQSRLAASEDLPQKQIFMRHFLLKERFLLRRRDEI